MGFSVPFDETIAQAIDVEPITKLEEIKTELNMDLVLYTQADANLETVEQLFDRTIELFSELFHTYSTESIQFDIWHVHTPKEFLQRLQLMKDQAEHDMTGATKDMQKIISDDLMVTLGSVMEFYEKEVAKYMTVKVPSTPAPKPKSGVPESADEVDDILQHLKRGQEELKQKLR